jgi:2-polyprenyl-3-methyl-5-hydroxy-6-metoxy-1,4-benzoquinol methylase
MTSSNAFSGYTTSFAAITTLFQDHAYEKTARYVTGRVLDAGSGCAKLAPYLHAKSVQSYLAVDRDEDMVRTGTTLLSRLARKQYNIRQADILETEGIFNTIVSIQSYYSWADTCEVLGKLFQSTAPGGTLLLATANDKLDIEHLIERSFKAHVMHPMWSEFVAHNRRLADMPGGRFVSLDTLIEEIKSVGYQVQETSTDLFDGGVNWVRAVRAN